MVAELDTKIRAARDAPLTRGSGDDGGVSTWSDSGDPGGTDAGGADLGGGDSGTSLGD